MKWCPSCESYRNIEKEFFRNKAKWDGLSDKCKSCDVAYRKEKRQRARKRDA